MVAALVLPLALQALAMGVDEFRFHRARGLSRWERVGHPVDTLSVLACYVVTLCFAMNPNSLRLYCGLAIFSCLLITKDEPLHLKRCEPTEQWLHAVLFLLHPIALGCAYLLWQRGERELLMMLTVLTTLWGFYQTIYWNTRWLKTLHL